MTPDQLQARYPQAESGLDLATWQQATTIGKSFIVADTTGQGAEQFPSYYANGYENIPWVKNLDVQWATAVQANNTVIKATVWYTGIAVQNGKQLTQVTQDVYLDSTKQLTPIQPNALQNYGITVDPSCCTAIAP